MNTASALLAALLLSATAAHAAGQTVTGKEVITDKQGGLLYCGELTNAFGPYDYRDSANAHELWLVEQAHFTSNVERGESGNSGTLAGELNYTLRAFPNHIRALGTLARLSKNGKIPKIPGMRYPVECFFDRAIRFAPNDGMVRAAYGNYLYAQGATDRALPFLEQGARMSPDNPGVQYNLGVVYFRMKRYKEANQAAQNAYAAAFPLPGLRRMLTEAGAWDESVRPVIAAKTDEEADDKAEAKTEAKPEVEPADAAPAAAAASKP